MKKTFEKGQRLEAADLQEIVNSLEALEGSVKKVVAGGRGKRGKVVPLASYNLTSEEASAGVYEVEDEPHEDDFDVPGLIRSIAYAIDIARGKIKNGAAMLPAPGVYDYDELSVANLAGRIKLPVMAKGVKDVAGRIWKLAELLTGPEFAATLARCTLPDGTVLELNLHTENGGTIMCFGLTTNGYYY